MAEGGLPVVEQLHADRSRNNIQTRKILPSLRGFMRVCDSDTDPQIPYPLEEQGLVTGRFPAEYLVQATCSEGQLYSSKASKYRNTKLSSQLLA